MIDWLRKHEADVRGAQLQVGALGQAGAQDWNQAPDRRFLLQAAWPGKQQIAGIRPLPGCDAVTVIVPSQRHLVDLGARGMRLEPGLEPGRRVRAWREASRQI